MLKDFISLIFPEVCLNCHTPRISGEEILCTKCLINLPKTRDYGYPDQEVLDKFVSCQKVNIAYSFLTFSKKGMVQKLLHHLKYEGNQAIGVSLGNWFGKELTEQTDIAGHDVIIPVPLHKSKLRTRGYNQSDCLAQGLSESLKIDWDPDAIRRVKKTLTQTKMGKVERWQNVSNIFQVINSEKILDKQVLVVDDVITTGATLNACVRAIEGAGASSIGVLVLAKADH